MAEESDATRSKVRSASDKSVESLAGQALTRLMKKRTHEPERLAERNIEKLQAAVLDPGHQAYWAAVSDMTSKDVSAEKIVDLYVPEVARRLGAAWCSDGLGFADVTIGAARLQAIVRELSSTLEAGIPRVSSVIIVVLSNEYHTLGAMVLKSQLRRLGISVRLLVGVPTIEAITEIRSGSYDAVMLSASHSESLETLAKFVEQVKSKKGQTTPVIIGGPILETATLVKETTGADVATSNLYEALRICQLKTSREARSTVRTGR